MNKSEMQQRGIQRKNIKFISNVILRIAMFYHWCIIPVLTAKTKKNVGNETSRLDPSFICGVFIEKYF